MHGIKLLLPFAVTIAGMSGMGAVQAETSIRLGGLLISEISAHEFDCLFGDNCNTSRARKQVSEITLPPGVTGKVTLETNTVLGSGSVPGSGKTGYAYRVSLAQARSALEAACVTGVTIDIGPITQLKYDGNLAADVFVINKGGLGLVGLYNAVTHGTATTFTFNQPLCAGETGGLDSYYFGVASVNAPKAVSVMLGWPGLDGISADARAPSH